MCSGEQVSPCSSNPTFSAGSAACRGSSLLQHSCWAPEERRTQCHHGSSTIPPNTHPPALTPQVCIAPGSCRSLRITELHCSGASLLYSVLGLDSEAELYGPQVSQNSFAQISLVSACRSSFGWSPCSLMWAGLGTEQHPISCGPFSPSLSPHPYLYPSLSFLPSSKKEVFTPVILCLVGGIGRHYVSTGPTSMQVWPRPSCYI